MYQITIITKEEKSDSIKKTIESLDGKILREESLGRKKFSYPIKKETAGFYQNYVFDISTSKLPELNKKLLLDDMVLRFLIVTKEMEVEVKPRVGKPTTKTEIILPEKEKLDNIKEEKVLVDKKELEKVKKKEIKKETKTEPLVIDQPPLTAPILEEKKEAVTEEERLKKLEEKLDELLKD